MWISNCSLRSATCTDLVYKRRSMASSGKVMGIEISTQHHALSRYPFSKVSRKPARVSADIAGSILIPDCTWGPVPTDLQRHGT